MNCFRQIIALNFLKREKIWVSYYGATKTFLSHKDKMEFCACLFIYILRTIYAIHFQNFEQELFLPKMLPLKKEKEVKLFILKKTWQ